MTLDEKTRRVLKHQMQQRQLSHAMVADRTYLNKTSVTRVLTGERQITLDKLEAFAKAFGCTASSLIKAAEQWQQAGLPESLRRTLRSV